MPPARRRPTIADVARRAGVSATAVSFAVNDRPGVSPETRERILDVARELGWRPSASARALT
jgi:DNA-binding LacI/PurR family transcriptional regulator